MIDGACWSLTMIDHTVYTMGYNLYRPLHFDDFATELNLL